jgi:hypothetical protein
MPSLQSEQMVREVRVLVGWIVFLGLTGSVAAIIAGGVLVYFGETGTSEITLFGQNITTASVGVACVFLGIVALIMIIRSAFKTLNKAIDAKATP